MDRTETMTRASEPDLELNRSYVDWPAILAGAVVASATAAVFFSFGAALGLTALSAEPGEGSGTLALVLSGLWMVVTLVASYGAGGYLAGRMRRRADRATADEVTIRDGVNGLVVWAVAMLIGVMVLTNTAASIVSGAGAVASTAVEATGSAVGGLAEGAMSAAGAAVPEGEDAMSYVTDTLVRPTEINPDTPTEDLSAQISRVLMNVVRTGEISDADRAFLERAVAARAGVPQAEVSARVDEAIAAAQETRAEAERLAEEARQTAIDAAETARISGILTAFVLAAAALVAAAAAYTAAVKGGKDRDEGKMFRGFS